MMKTMINNMLIDTRTVWLIMSKDLQWVAKGHTGSYKGLVRCNDKRNRQRLLTYNSRGAALNNRSNLYTNDSGLQDKDLIAVEATLTITLND